jgi:hypothetical protein
VDITGGAWSRSNCPHKASGLTKFSSLYSLSSLTAGANLTIPSGKNVLLKQCYLPDIITIFNRITIQFNASLIFDDSNISLHGMYVL